VVRWLALAALLGATACAANDIPEDCRISPGSKARDCLPSGPLGNVAAEVRIVSRAELDLIARQDGGAPSAYQSVNEYTFWKRKPCLIYLADDGAGMASIEHGLWHCKLGLWHK